MDEHKILKRIRQGNSHGLDIAIRQYSAYVVTVIHNRACGCLSPEDEEEIASDVFLSLWQNAAKIEPGRLRSWLGRVSSNKTVDHLRRQKTTVPLEDYTMVVEDPQWEAVSRREQAELVEQALQRLSPSDREIFYRYYDLCQSTAVIAEEMHMVPATVRSRLSRGRAALRDTLCQRGFVYED